MFIKVRLIRTYVVGPYLYYIVMRIKKLQKRYVWDFFLFALHAYVFGFTGFTGGFLEVVT